MNSDNEPLESLKRYRNMLRSYCRVFFLQGLLGCLLLSAPALGAETPSEIRMIRSDTANLEDWQEKQFQGQTLYRKTILEGRGTIEADSRGSASALFKETVIDIREFPYLSWRWRIIRQPETRNEREKEGDDFAARVYVVVKEGPFPWQTRAINYVWSKREKKGAVWPNPFIDKAIMVSLNNEADGLDHWVSNTVNIYEDLQRLLGKTYTKIDGIAIMSDSDNSGSSARADYSDIRFTRLPPEPRE